jgi:uncharacterized membrane protein
MSKATITVLRPREELERLWREQDPLDGPTVTFTDAPGDRGTEIHVDVESGGVLSKLSGSDPRAKAMDALRRFKALVETGEVPRSDATPEGELAERKLKQRPAQPLDASEREKAGV